MNDKIEDGDSKYNYYVERLRKQLSLVVGKRIVDQFHYQHNKFGDVELIMDDGTTLHLWASSELNIRVTEPKKLEDFVVICDRENPITRGTHVRSEERRVGKECVA
jgi:hypothetical protein